MITENTTLGELEDCLTERAEAADGHVLVTLYIAPNGRTQTHVQTLPAESVWTPPGYAHAAADAPTLAQSLEATLSALPQVPR